MRLIDAEALYDKVVQRETEAVEQVEKHRNDENPTEWIKWSTILTERSAFKFDVMDAPIVERMKRIEDKNVYDITLLSVEEAKNVPKEILRTKCWWWLRSPGISSTCAALVDNVGNIFSGGTDVNIDGSVGVRPALVIRDLESLHLRIGEKVSCLNRTWLYVDENLILSEYVIDFRPFNESRAKGNNFLDSDIKQYLDDILWVWRPVYRC